MNASTIPIKQVIRSSLLGYAICLLSLPGYAITVQDIANPRQTYGGWVTDSAQILKPETEDQLNQIIDELEARNGAEIAVVTVSNTTPAPSPKVFATELFNDWHIGKKGQDNGVLFLISVGDRRVEVETGYGVEAILPDAKVSRIIQQEVTPRFKQGDFDGGTLAGTRTLVMVLEGQEAGENMPSGTSTDQRWVRIMIVVGGALGILGGVKSLYRWSKQNGGQASQGFKELISSLFFRQSIALPPAGLSRVPAWHRWFETAELPHCKNCGQQMQSVPLPAVESQLTPAQKVAEAIGSVEFTGWCCPHCSAEKIHLRIYETLSPQFMRCPDCHELTEIEKDREIIQHSTPFQSGLLLKIYQCQCCSYREEVEQEIYRHAGWTGSDSFGDGYSGSGGGDSFGGGHSGGGGGGGSW